MEPEISNSVNIFCYSLATKKKNRDLFDENDKESRDYTGHPIKVPSQNQPVSEDSHFSTCMQHPTAQIQINTERVVGPSDLEDPVVCYHRGL